MATETAGVMLMLRYGVREDMERCLAKALQGSSTPATVRGISGTLQYRCYPYEESMGRCHAHWMVVLTLVLAGCADTEGTQMMSSTSIVANVPDSTAVVPPTAEPPAQPAIAPTLQPTSTFLATTAASSTASSTPSIAASPTVAPLSTPTVMVSPPASPHFIYPISRSGGVPGDGFFIRHGYATENTWFNPNHWHTGEDWYALEGDTAGAEVRAVADGEVVYVGSNYPGRVVIVRHADDLFSMYGHLDPAVAVTEGQRVSRNDLLGTVLRRGDDVPNHLHFEMRTFLFTDAVNGTSPRYPFRCGPGCTPGPGYWPIDAPELPDVLGWRNPTHVLAGRTGWTASDDSAVDVLGEVIMATGAPSQTLGLWTTLDESNNPVGPQGELILQPGEHYAVLDTRAGHEAPEQTGATAYRLWYRLLLEDGRTGWVAALSADGADRGSNGMPSSVRFNLLPDFP